MTRNETVFFLPDRGFSEKTVSALLDLPLKYAREDLENIWEKMLSILSFGHAASQKNMAKLLELFQTHLSPDMLDADMSVLESAITHSSIREPLVYCGWWFVKRFFSGKTVFPKQFSAGLCFLQDCLADPLAIERHFDMYALAENRIDSQKLKKLDERLNIQVASGKLTTTQAKNEREELLFSEALRTL